jgi:hypothetical protein
LANARAGEEHDRPNERNDGNAPKAGNGRASVPIQKLLFCSTSEGRAT